MAATIQILNDSNGPLSQQAEPAGLAAVDDGLALCGEVEARAIAVVKKDQDVWLISQGKSLGARVDGDALTESIPLSNGVRLSYDDTHWIVRLDPDTVTFAPAPTPQESAAIAQQQVKRERRRRTRSLLAGCFVLLLLIAAGAAGGWYYLKQPQPVVLTFESTPQSVAIDGQPLDDIDARLELAPGQYVIDAVLPGHAPIRDTITVRRGLANRFEYAFEPLDGILTVLTNVENATVLLDGEPVTGDATFIELPAGTYTVRVEAGQDYIPFESTVAVKDLRQETLVEANLKPNWGFVQLDTDPPGARVFDASTGELIETTPMNLKLLSGNYNFRIEASDPGYVPHNASVDVRPESDINLGLHTFQIIPGRLRLSTTPPGASVLVNGRTADRNTPLTLDVPPSADAVIEVFAEGYEPSSFLVNLDPGQAEEHAITLKQLTGEVRIESVPGVAEVFDASGKRLGLTPLQVDLPASEQKLTLKKEGYDNQAIVLTPLADRTIVHKAALIATVGGEEEKRAALVAKAADAPAKLTGPQDIELVRIDPGEFTMGSPKSEPGRLPNEAAVKVRFTLPFYVQTTEVTNAQYRAFKANHASGRLGFHTLDTDDRPAVDVSWDDAAAFCNHLSKQANLDPVYQQNADGMVAINPLPNGYRLPTEAEFEYLLRAASGEDPFPWGAFLPPPARSGNFADKAAASALGASMSDYEDPFVGTAPVASFAADKHGLYDVTGNVGEWMHDNYVAVYPSQPTPLLNYAGPKPRAKALRVVRGASYRDHLARNLRSAHRRTASDPSKDIGFRVVLPLAGAAVGP